MSGKKHNIVVCTNMDENNGECLLGENAKCTKMYGEKCDSYEFYFDVYRSIIFYKNKEGGNLQ